jgi:YHS domain-containing protein
MLSETARTNQAINAGGDQMLEELVKINKAWEEANKPSLDALQLPTIETQRPLPPTSPSEQLIESDTSKTTPTLGLSNKKKALQAESNTTSNEFVPKKPATGGAFQFEKPPPSSRTTSTKTTPNNTASTIAIAEDSASIGIATSLESSTSESPFDNLIQTSATDQLRVVNQYVQPESSQPKSKPAQNAGENSNQNNVAPATTPNSAEAVTPKQEVANTSAVVVSNVPTVALDGDCPVSLMTTNQWVKGDPKFGCVHRGRIYLFASQECQDRFLQSPDLYSPLLAGYDPVIFHEQSTLVEGQKAHGVFMSRQGRQHVVLFRDEDTRAKFRESPAVYLESIRSATENADGK